MLTQREAAAAFQSADNDWETEMQALYGVAAQDFRYFPEARGAEGSSLRAAFEARCKAHDAWLAACNCGPVREVAA